MKIRLFVILAMIAGPVHARAQANAAAVDPEVLIANVTVAGGYDDDVTAGGAAPSNDPRQRAGGSFAMANLGLNYGLQGRRVSFGAGASSSLRFYRAIETFTADTYAGSVAMSAAVAPRLRVTLDGSASRSSHYTLTILPVFIDDIGTANVQGPSLDYNLSATELTRYRSGIQLNYVPRRRSTVYANYATTKSSAREHAFELRTTTWGGGYSHSLTQNASLRLGFYRQQATFMGARGLPVDSYDIGVNYSRPLSFSRRTTLRFGGGSAVIQNADGRNVTMIGHAALAHRFSRAWTLNAAYNRGVGFVDGFTDPVLTDSVAITLQGAVNRRVTLINTAGFSNGSVGLQAISSPSYKSYTALARAQFMIARGLFAYSEYVYYHYQFDNPIVLPFAAPSRLNRQGIRGGIMYNVPLL